MRAIVVVLATLPLVTCSIQPASAKEDDDVAAARLHYRQGTRAFDLGHYDEAVREYEAAYKAKDDPALLYNIGQAYRLNGDLPAALRAYKSYLHRVPNAENIEEVRQRIAEIQRQIDEQPKPAPHPSEEPSTVAPPPVTTTTPPPRTVTVGDHQTEKSRTPVYKRWYLWTAVGVVVLGGVAVTLALTLTAHSDGFTSTIPDVGPGMHSALGVRF